MAHADDDRISAALDTLDRSLGESAHDYDITVRVVDEDIEIQIRARDEGATN